MALSSAKEARIGVWCYDTSTVYKLLEREDTAFGNTSFCKADWFAINKFEIPINYVFIKIK